MIHFNNKLDYTNISIGEYIELQDLLLNNTDGLEQQDLVMQEIQILYGRDPYKMSMPEFKKAVESLSFLAKEMPKMKIKDSYFLNGNKYVLHKELSEFKVAHYVDYEMIMKTQKGIESYPHFLALFLIPDGHEYNDGYNMETAINDIKSYLSIADAVSLANFFKASSVLFTSLFLRYLKTSTAKTIKNRKERKMFKNKMRQLIHLTITGYSH
jgi:hypothetical protein